MNFVPHTQQELQSLGVVIGQSYEIEYMNKDYFNAEVNIERGRGTAMQSEHGIIFSVQDPYGMDKMVMQVRVLS